MPSSFSRRQLLGGGAAIAGVALAGGLTSAVWAQPSPNASVLDGLPGPASVVNGAQVQQALERVADLLLLMSPEGATSLGLDTGNRAELKSRLADRSLIGVELVKGELQRVLAKTAGWQVQSDDPSHQISLDVVRTAFELGVSGFNFDFGDVSVGGWRNSPYVVAQNVGAYLDIPRFLTNDHKIENRGDADAYLERMQSFARQLDGETERLRIAAGKQVIAPDFLLDKTLNQLTLSRGNPAQSDMVTHLIAKTESLGGDYGARAEQIATEAIWPALERQIEEVRRHRARADDRAGVWTFPDGEAYYRWALQAGTTTDHSPDEVHQLGLDQLAQLQGQMDTILKGIGYSTGSVGERMTALGRDPRYQFPDNDEGRAQIIALLEERINGIRGLMPRAFNTLVPGNVEVKRLPLAEEPGAPGAYGGPGTIDGSVPGRLWINLRNTSIWPRYSLPDLAYHEAIPGHVWQGEYSFRLPLVRSILSFNAYSEGWALYGEQLADELGVYASDPVERLGYLQSLAFRACRLVVDTGIHAKQWTRAQAIEWFSTTNGSSVEEVQGEVDRYCSWPGQACGYKVGHTEINALRDRARQTLGRRYDMKAFNDAVITAGNVPMTVLGRVVDRYIAGARR